MPMEAEDKANAKLRPAGCLTSTAYLIVASDVIIMGYAHAHQITEKLCIVSRKNFTLTSCKAQYNRSKAY